MTHANQTLHKLLSDCPAEVILAEARKIGMHVEGGETVPRMDLGTGAEVSAMAVSVYGTREQWAELEQRIYEKPGEKK